MIWFLGICKRTQCQNSSLDFDPCLLLLKGKNFSQHFGASPVFRATFWKGDTRLSLRADDWLLTAVDCLEFLPDELVVEVSRGLLGCADDLPQCKRLMYEVLAQHYGHTQQTPLLSNRFFDIHSGISELLGTTGSIFFFFWSFCGDACFGGVPSNIPVSLCRQ